MKELNLQKLICLAMPANARIFRNNVGVGWIGTRIVTDRPGIVSLRDARPLHAGLCEGSSDLIGYTTINITPDMVGRQVAIFTAVEVKTQTGRATPAQLNFIEQVRRAGGIAGIARTPDEARNLIQNSLK